MIPSKSIQIVKVPESLIKKINDMGIYTEILFWYRLKALKIEGSFHNTEIQNLVFSTYGISKSTCWEHIKKLSDWGLIKKKDNYYTLVSYDKLFLYLQYDLSFKFKWDKIQEKLKIVRKGLFRIYKISTDLLINIEDFIDQIALKEIELNINKQIKQYRKYSSESKYRELLIQAQLGNKNINRTYIDDLLKSRQDLRNHPLSIFTLSCLRVAELLGFTSKSSGHRIEQRLKKKGLLIVQNRKLLYEDNYMLAYTNRKYYQSLSPNFVMENYKLYYQLPNLLIINVPN